MVSSSPHSIKKNLKNYIDDFLDFLLNIRGYSQQTIVTYSIALKQMYNKCEYYEDDGKSILDIMQLRIDISGNNKRTIGKKLSAIRSFVKYTKEHKNITIELIGDSSIKVPQTLPKPIAQDYIDEVLKESNLEDRLLLGMLYGLGLRISELSHLKLSQIKLNEMDQSWVEVIGKGNKSRQLPLLPYIQTLISEYVKVNSPKKYLFEKKSIPLNSAQLRYKITKIFAKQGIKATPHQLRHSFATHLLNNGARISDVSELLGHSSMATTQIYTKLANSKKLDTYMKAHPLAHS